MPKKFDFAENFSKYFRKFKKLTVKNLNTNFYLNTLGKLQRTESKTALSHKAGSQVLHYPTKHGVKYYAVP